MWVWVCMHKCVPAWCRLMESCHPQKGGLSACTVSTPVFIVCTPICPALMSGCVWCVLGCVSMSLLWSEMTLRNTEMLPTVNIIQYHPTGINIAILLLAENVSLLQFFSVAALFGADLFPASDVLNDHWWLIINECCKKGWVKVWALVDWFLDVSYVHVCLSDSSVCLYVILTGVSLLQCLSIKMSKYCRCCRFCMRLNN